MNPDDTRSAGSPSTTPTTQSTGNTAPLDHVLPDDPSTWTALDHAVATANLRGTIIASERERVARLEALFDAMDRHGAVLRDAMDRGGDYFDADVIASANLYHHARAAVDKPGDLDGAGEGGE